jgi:hypothetical protein
MLRAFCGTEDTSPKSDLTKEKKSSRRTSENELSLAERDLASAVAKAKGWNLRPLFLGGHHLIATVRDLAGSAVEPVVIFLNDDRPPWHGLLVLPVQSCTQKTQAIGQRTNPCPLGTAESA